MEKKTITQAEQTTRFNEWIRTQNMPEFDEVIERQRWWVHKVIEFDKITAEEYDVCAGFWVDGNGQVHYPDKENDDK